MTDIFFSYSSKDRERVRPLYEALSALGFDVFWDQQVPAGTDWDTWIKEKLASARSAVVFWSLSSIGSDNVRHEATVAKTQGKLVPVMLDALRVDQFPMGLFNTQAARLMEWTGSGEDAEWRKLLSEIESKATPAWVQRRMAVYEEEILSERRKREAAQAKGDAARTQLEKEIAGYDDLRRAREQAVSEAEKARAETAGIGKALETAKEQVASLRAERDKAAGEAAEMRAELASAREALTLAEHQKEDLSGRLAAVERLSVAHRGTDSTAARRPIGVLLPNWWPNIALAAVVAGCAAFWWATADWRAERAKRAAAAAAHCDAQEFAGRCNSEPSCKWDWDHCIPK